MQAQSHPWRIAFLPVLLIVLPMLTATSASAVITDTERDNCQSDWTHCESNCTLKAGECGEPGSKNHNSCYKDCRKICDYKKSDCLGDADKDAPKAPPTKVQPKATPGGAEQPGTESPNVRPEGGIQR
jgi:hypothetical protein